MGNRAGLFSLALMAILGLALAASHAGAAAQDHARMPFIPGYWDPQAPVEKPDLTGLKAIRFIAGDDYPPFNVGLPDGTLMGFNVDLARAICDELQIACTIQSRPWNTILPAIVAKEGDAAIASLAITDVARRTVAFTAPYYRTPARFLVRLPTPFDEATPELLAGKRVGVEAGSAHEAYLRAFFPAASVTAFPTAAAARAALKAGSLDALFADGIDSALWLDGTDADGCCAFLGGPFTESRFFGEGAGIAVRKGDTTLRRALDYALARLSAKGLYADIYLKYFPIGFY